MIFWCSKGDGSKKSTPVGILGDDITDRLQHMQHTLEAENDRAAASLNLLRTLKLTNSQSFSSPFFNCRKEQCKVAGDWPDVSGFWLLNYQIQVSDQRSRQYGRAR